MAAFADDVFVDAAACGDMDHIRSLLEDNRVTSDMVNALDKDGRSAFHYACLNDDEPLLRLFLADERVDVALRSPKGDTCFHLAALYASLQALKLLFIDERASKLINEKNKWGETCLHLCAGSGDKGASKTATLLLEAGASVVETDQWLRGPLDVARDNGEAGMVSVLEAYLAAEGRSALKEAVDAITAAYKHDTTRSPAIRVNKGLPLAGAGPASMFGDIKGARLGLKKVKVTEKQIFAPVKVSKAPRDADYIEKHDARSTGKILSKLIDFPGDVLEITAYLADDSVDAGGCDAYGLSALHKFASWNKVELMDMLLPKLSTEQINAQDPGGKTALHWACEMASVAAVQRLVACPQVDASIKDTSGKSPSDVLNAATGSSVIDRLKLALQPKEPAA